MPFYFFLGSDTRTASAAETFTGNTILGDVCSFDIPLIRFFPEIFLASSILFLIIHAATLTPSRSLGHPLLVRSYTRLSMLVILLTLILVVNDPLNEASSSFLAYNKTFIFDSLSQNTKQILLVGVLFCLYISENIILSHKINTFEYLVLMLCATLGLLLLTSAYDLISLYLAIEVQSLCLYVLAASKKNSSFSLDAGLKYFILGSFSSGLFLFGASLIYGATGTTNFFNFSLLFSGLSQGEFPLGSTMEHAWVLISIAFLFKIAAAPFHM